MMPQIQKIKQVMNTLRNANNPQAMLTQMAQQNPNIKQLLEIGKQYNGDYNKAFEDIARKNGYNPQDIRNMCR